MSLALLAVVITTLVVPTWCQKELKPYVDRWMGE